MTPTLESLHRFLALEAELLDAWKLLEWADLFTEDGEYLVPATDEPEGKPEETVHLIYDNRHRLGERAKRLLKKSAHAEFPHSRTLHTISNQTLRFVEGNIAHVGCAFVAYRAKADRLDIYPGRSEYQIRFNSAGEYRIRKKTSILALEMLRPQNKLSIII